MPIWKISLTKGKGQTMELEELLHNRQRLLWLLEEESLVAADCFSGEILEEYRKLLEKERGLLQGSLRSLP